MQTKYENKAAEKMSQYALAHVDIEIKGLPFLACNVEKQIEEWCRNVVGNGRLTKRRVGKWVFDHHADSDTKT